jgi:peptidyl-dipeptidase A
MMDALIDDPGWLRSVTGAKGEDLDRDAAKLAAHRRVDRMILTRFVLVMYHFEQALYADPDSGELNSVWWDLVERFFYVDRPPGATSPTGPRSSTSRSPPSTSTTTCLGS